MPDSFGSSEYEADTGLDAGPELPESVVRLVDTVASCAAKLDHTMKTGTRHMLAGVTLLQELTNDDAGVREAARVELARDGHKVAFALMRRAGTEPIATALMAERGAA